MNKWDGTIFNVPLVQKNEQRGRNNGDVENLFRQSCQNKKKNVEF